MTLWERWHTDQERAEDAMTLEEVEKAAESGRRVTRWRTPPSGTIRTKAGEGIIEHDLENEAYTFVYDGGRRERVEVLDMYDFTHP